MTHSWQKQEAEDNKWFKRFSLYYLSQAGSRSVLAAENLFLADTNKIFTPVFIASPDWEDAARIYKWESRGTDYDKWLAKLAKHDHRNLIINHRNTQIETYLTQQKINQISQANLVTVLQNYNNALRTQDIDIETQIKYDLMLKKSLKLLSGALIEAQRLGNDAAGIGELLERLAEIEKGNDENII